MRSNIAAKEVNAKATRRSTGEATSQYLPSIRITKTGRAEAMVRSSESMVQEMTKTVRFGRSMSLGGSWRMRALSNLASAYAHVRSGLS